jgi:outer membrane protein assembly factor BamD (BamD/ComL family)
MQEAALLDRARQQLWHRDGEGARRTADSYLARFPHGRLAVEAQVIRVHAAFLTGGPTAAAPLARAFLRLHPDSPHAPAVRRMLTE